MPRQFTDEEGNTIDVPTDEELEALNEKVLKVEELETKLKELESEVNPNWREARKKIEGLETYAKKLEERAMKEGLEIGDKKALTEDDANKIAETKVKEGILNDYRDELLLLYKDKEADVRSYFDLFSKSAGIASKEDVKKYVQAAGRAAGLAEETNSMGLDSPSGGSEPQFKDTTKKSDFTETEEGLGFMKSLGLPDEVIKGKKEENN
jgi:hypothetical protein